MRMLTAFNLSMPGVPCLYQSDEYADVGGNDPDNRRMVRFDALDADEADTRAHVAEWNRLRRSRMSLLYGQTLIEALPTGLLRIERQYLDETTTVYINPTPSPVTIEVMSEVVAGAVQDGELPAYGCVAMAGAS